MRSDDSPRSTLTVLGSGSGMPSADRAGSGYLLKRWNDLTLFDCGSGVVRSLLQQGFDPLQLRRVFISHAHSDHVSDLFLLIQLLHAMSAGTTLRVYLPSELVGPFEVFLPSLYLFRQRLRFTLEVWPIEPGAVCDDGVKVTAIPNTHHHKLMADIGRLESPNRMQSFSFGVTLAEASFLYSGDIGALSDIGDSIGQYGLILLETTHVDSSEIVSLAARHATRRFVLTHLQDEERASELRGLIAKQAAANVSLASDGLTITL
jgi:ribonuclease BN (tRNA processing enzyme)